MTQTENSRRIYNGTRHSVYVGNGRGGWSLSTFAGEFRVYAPEGYDSIHFTLYADANSTLFIEAHDGDSQTYYDSK